MILVIFTRNNFFFIKTCLKMMIFGVILSWGRGLNGGRGQKDGRGQTHPHVKFELALGEGCLIVQVFAGPANFGGTT